MDKPRSSIVTVNRAAVLTLWAGVVAERLGYSRDEALTLGRAVAGLNAQSKGLRLGIYAPEEEAPARRKRPEPQPGKSLRIELMGRAVPAVKTPEGFRAVNDGRPINPESVENYVESKFGESLGQARDAMKARLRAGLAVYSSSGWARGPSVSSPGCRTLPGNRTWRGRRRAPRSKRPSTPRRCDSRGTGHRTS